MQTYDLYLTDASARSRAHVMFITSYEPRAAVVGQDWAAIPAHRVTRKRTARPSDKRQLRSHPANWRRNGVVAVPELRAKLPSERPAALLAAPLGVYAGGVDGHAHRSVGGTRRAHGEVRVCQLRVHPYSGAFASEGCSTWRQTVVDG